MPAGIEIRNGQASMFYVDEPAWHGLGRRLNRPATAQEAIEAAQLNWEVIKVPLYAAGGKSELLVKDKFGVVRKDLWPGQDCKVLGRRGEPIYAVAERGGIRVLRSDCR
jgi:hypothetical protein